jgi:hypothetical protein
MADNQPTPAELETMTNTVLAPDFGTEAPTEGQPQDASPKTDEPAQETAPQEQTPAQPDGGQVGISPEILKVLEETPYKTIPDVVKGYKELQSQYTKVNEKVKPFEQLLNDISADPNIAKFVQEAVFLAKNPELARAYQAKNSPVDTPPDPRQYDLYDPTQLQQYNEAFAQYMQRQVDVATQSRFKEVEQAREIDRMKMELKQSFPEADADEILAWVKQPRQYSLSDAYKLKNWDAREQQLTEKIRKELNNRIETAGKGTPTASASPPKQESISDIANFAAKHGEQATIKKYGQGRYMEAMQSAASAYLN